MIKRVTQVYDEDINPKVNQGNTKPEIKKNKVTRTSY
jgi:hypothetical protein